MTQPEHFYYKLIGQPNLDGSDFSLVEQPTKSSTRVASLRVFLIRYLLVASEIHHHQVCKRNLSMAGDPASHITQGFLRSLTLSKLNIQR